MTTVARRRTFLFLAILLSILTPASFAMAVAWSTPAMFIVGAIGGGGDSDLVGRGEEGVIGRLE